MCLNFSFTFLLSSPIRCDRNLAGPLSGRYICFPGSSSTKHGLAHHNSQHSELKKWVKEKEGERDCQLSQWGMLRSRLRLPFLPSRLFSSFYYSAARSNKKKKKKKKKKGVTECSSHRNSFLLFPQRRVVVQAWKCSRLKETRVHTKGQSAANKVEVNTGIRVIN